MIYNFKDKAILITGSTRGIGMATAGRLLASGATVGIHGRTADSVNAACEALKGTAGQTIPIPFDLDSPENAAEAVKAFHRLAGRLDGLVNNAGGGKSIPFRGITLDGWHKTFRTNLDASMLASREAYIIMRNSGTGSIINVGSIAAHGPGKWMGADYAASKAGLISLTKSLAFESARFGIRVNAVSPGLAETDMTKILPQNMRDSLGIPMKRLASPDEVAMPIVWLLSDESSYLTGEVLHIDGGLFM